LLNTVDLVQRVTAGEHGALDELVDRSLPVFGKWAIRRIPGWAAGKVDVTTLVRSALLDALPRLRALEASSAGALQAALRDAVCDRLANELRAMAGQLPPDEVESPLTASILEQATGRWNLERYDRGLAELAGPDREAIIGRLELRQSYEELATALGEADAAAARFRVTKAVARLIHKMVALS
jgi:hypothetical protein